MSQKFKVIDGSGGSYALSCPICGDNNALHIDDVQVAARPSGEDGRITLHQLNARGEATTPESVPVGPEMGEGRRHRIALIGWCEHGHKFAIVYTQHKGETYVDTVGLGSLD
jgi:hypothetical protein